MSTSAERPARPLAARAVPALARPAVALVLLGPLLVLWPLPVAWPSALVTSAMGEGARHLWGWWMALETGQPLGGPTTLLGFPAGVEMPLVDPLHVVPYALGAALGGPGSGWALVCWFGLAVGGIGAALLAREVRVEGGGQLVAAAVGVAVPGMVAAAVDGITEGLGAGWVAVQLAALLALGRDPRPWRVGPLAAALAAAAHAGPYNAVWCALLDAAVGLWLLRRTRLPLAAGGLAALACVPFARVSWFQPAGRPGAADLTAPQPPPSGLPWRGSWREGVDLLDLILPGPLTPEAPLATTAYLGPVLLALVVLGAWRWRRSGGRPWPWLVGGAAFALLALGPWLVVGGHLVEAGGVRVVLPAGLLERVPPLDRMTRWYRAGAVAALLLAPVAAHAARGRLAPVAAVAVLLDLRWMAPLPVVLPTAALPDAAALAMVHGPLASLPVIHPLGRPDAPADADLLLQIQHGQPISRPADDVAAGQAHPGLRSVQRAWRMPPSTDAVALARSGGRQLSGAGFRYLVVDPQALPGVGAENLTAAFGEPTGPGDGLRVWALPR